MSKNGKFVIKKITKFSDVLSGKVEELPESDLCFQNEKGIAQFEYVKGDAEKDKHSVTPGMYTLTLTNSGLKPMETELCVQDLLKDIISTTKITNEAKTFFDRLHIYEKLNRPKKRGVLLYSDPGMGKCFGKDTSILMYDGTTKMVQNIEKDDVLMGPDSKPRNVLSTATGRETMYSIVPTKGESYVVNESHILSLKMSGCDDLYNMSVKDFLMLPAWKKERLKSWRVGVEFDNHDELPIDPYILGLWLGDGSSCGPTIHTADDPIKSVVIDYFENKLNLLVKTRNYDNNLTSIRGVSGQDHGKRDRNIFINYLRQLDVWGNKHIPLIYKTASRENRLKLLAGLIDSDGCYYCGIFDFNLKSKQLADNITYLARSLGFAAYIRENVKICTNSKTRTADIYHRVQISGNMVDVPCVLERKQANTRKQIKNILRTGITVDKLDVDDYYGFTVDGDHLFLLNDFTVTHNSSAIADFCTNAVKEDAGTVVFLWPTSKVEAEDVSHFLSVQSEFTDKCTRLILVIEDIGGSEHEGHGGARGVDSGMLNLLDGLEVTFRLPTFIMATTNYPQNLLKELADRPRRFDLLIKLDPPSANERVKLAEFIAKRSLNDDEKKALEHKQCNVFSIAHIEEMIIRSLLHDKTFVEVIKEIVDHKEKFAKEFNDNTNSVGFGQ